MAGIGSGSIQRHHHRNFPPFSHIDITYVIYQCLAFRVPGWQVGKCLFSLSSSKSPHLPLIEEMHGRWGRHKQPCMRWRKPTKPGGGGRGRRGRPEGMKKREVVGRVGRCKVGEKRQVGLCSRLVFVFMQQQSHGHAMLTTR